MRIILAVLLLSGCAQKGPVWSEPHCYNGEVDFDLEGSELAEPVNARVCFKAMYEVINVED